MIEVKNLTKRYGSHLAVNDISFTVGEGEILGFLGPNGAGKSTTLNTIAGLLKPREGSITFDGKNITGMNASKMVYNGMALCPEGRRIFPDMTVLENLKIGAYLRKDKAEIEQDIQNTLEREVSTDRCISPKP